MKCWVCKRKFEDGDLVVDINVFVVNEKRGDFVGNVPRAHAHARHLKEGTS